jgi:ATP-dependent RNA helicase RhlE
LTHGAYAYTDALVHLIRIVMTDHTRTGNHRAEPTTSTTTDSLEGAFGALIPELQRAVSAVGYTTPSPIQEQCIGHIADGRDVLGCAQTGTGKTAAFTLPLLQRLSKHSKRPRRGSPRALILAPTRELAAQIGESVNDYGRFLRLSHTVIFGGVKQHRQVKALNRGVDILVATPGRLLDLMEQGFIHLDEVEVFVLDEVDRMLDMGFLPDMKRVLKAIPNQRQTLFFSATMAPNIVKLADTMVDDPVRVTIAPEQPAVERIKQTVMFVSQKNKNKLLGELLRDPAVGKVIVFTQMKHVANRVVQKLGNQGIGAAAIHGNKSQSARIKALDGFKAGRFRVLVATDVAARGIDVDDITHVINYDLPVEAETYVHRIGRTARAGANGEAISFCTPEERAYLHAIERLLGEPVDADMDHDLHCQEAVNSTMPPAKQGGGGRGRRSGGRNHRLGGGSRRGSQNRSRGRSASARQR